MNRIQHPTTLAITLLCCGALIGLSLEELFDLLSAPTAWLPITVGAVVAIRLLIGSRLINSRRALPRPSHTKTSPSER